MQECGWHQNFHCSCFRITSASLLCVVFQWQRCIYFFPWKKSISQLQKVKHKLPTSYEANEQPTESLVLYECFCAWLWCRRRVQVPRGWGRLPWAWRWPRDPQRTWWPRRRAWRVPRRQEGHGRASQTWRWEGWQMCSPWGLHRQGERSWQCTSFCKTLK